MAESEHTGSDARRGPVARFQEFLHLESSGGLVLMAVSALAIIIANSPFAEAYNGLLDLPFEIRLGDASLAKPLILWINDGLMAIFFLLVGLEIKREVVQGALSSWRRAALPLYGAIGGMVVPIVIFLAIVGTEVAESRGWAIPAATDIAFALGVMALLGDRVPSSLKILLLAIAIIDDLAAIAIIALFYTDNLSTTMLGLAAIGGVGLAALNFANIRSIIPYLLIGLFVWVCVLKSGIHATLAGVAIAMAIPLKRDAEGDSPLHAAEHGLHPWVAYLILPIFAFANAGVSFDGLSLAAAAEPVPLGVALGLFAGKQIGVFGAAFLAVSLGLAARPTGASWSQIYAVAILCGIGFTMSLFISSLAFETSVALDNAAKLGILLGSTISAFAGYFLLRASLNPAVKEAAA